MRAFVRLGVLVGLAAAGCRSDVICCSRENGDPVLTQRGICLDHDLSVISDYICDGITDIDLDLDDDVGDTDAVDTDGGDPVNEKLRRCTEFCAGEQEQCPEDSACMESCDHSACAPDDAAITCANDATDCTQANTCWGLPWFYYIEPGDTDEDPNAPTCEI